MSIACLAELLLKRKFAEEMGTVASDCAVKEGCAQVCREAGQAAHILSAEALSLDEFQTLQGRRLIRGQRSGATVEVYSVDERGLAQGQEPPGGDGKRAIY